MVNPTGMSLYQDTLYVVVRDGIAVIDPSTGTVIKTVPISGASFPNDIVFNSDGTGYITDNGRSPETAIFRFKNGEVTPWLSSEIILKPNGIVMHAGKLIVGDKRDFCLKSIDPADQTIRILAQFPSEEAPGTFDGVQVFDENHLIMMSWSGKGYLVSLTGEVSEVINTAELNCEARPMVSNADGAFVPGKQIFVIPTFMDDRLLAYRFPEFKP